jgi:putative DNA primase/helicase
MNAGQSDFKERARKVRENVDLAELIRADGIELHREGTHWKGLCPFHSETTPSLAVYDDGGYYCHGCQAHGDAITYVHERQGVTKARALEILEGDKAPKLTTPRASTGAEKRRRYRPIMPIPDVALQLKPTFEAWLSFARASLRPKAVWWYQSQGGSMLMVDARYEYPHPERPGETKKEVRTWCWASDEDDGSDHWVQTRPSANVPLYGLEQLVARDADLVVIGEGAKKAEAIKRWSPHVGTSWAGGAAAVEKTDWSPLKGRRCLVWPDFDKVGVIAATAVVEMLLLEGAEVVGVIDLSAVQPALPEGYDAADCANGSELLGRLERVVPADQQHLRAMFAAYPGDLEKAVLKRAAKLGLVEENAADSSTSSTPDADAHQADEPDDAGDDAPPTDPPADEAAADDARDPDLERADIANATAFVDQHRQRVRYCAELDRWHVWDGRCWAVAPGEKGSSIPGAVMRLAEMTALRLAARHAELATALRKEAHELLDQAAKSDTPDSEKIKLHGRADSKRKAAKGEDRLAEAVQKRRVMQDMVILASCRRELVIMAAQLDKHDYFLNALNGTIDLRDGRLYDHDPAHLITRICAVEYHPKATSDALARIIAHVTRNDQAVAAYAQQVLGHSLFGHNDLEQVYLWWGPGGSGKGTLMEALKFALGDYALKAEFQSFIKTPGARVRDDLDRLKEARVVLASEVDHGEEIAAAVLKEMSGGDTIASRQLYGSYKEFRPRMTLHLQANERPRVDDRDSGIWRRMVCIPCGDTVPADQRDPALKTRLRDPEGDARAVLAWLVAGAIATHSVKYLPMPPAVEEATRMYRQSNNPLADFFAERLRFADPKMPTEARLATWATSDAVHHELKIWYELSRVQARSQVSPKRFRERLADWGVVYKRCERDARNTQHYLGLTLARYDRGSDLYDINDNHKDTRTRIPDPKEHEDALQFLQSGGFQVSTFPHGAVNPSCAHARVRTPMCDVSQTDGNMETWKPGKGEEEPPPDLTSDAFDPDRGAKP